MEQLETFVPPDPGVPVSHEPKPASAAPAPDKGGEKKAADDADIQKQLKDLRTELESTKTRLQETERSERYWAERAKSGEQVDDEGAEDGADPEPAEDKPERLLDEIASDGAKALATRGFVRASEVRKMVDAAVNQALSENNSAQQFDQRLAKEFPDLSNRDSELFRATQVHFRQMIDIDPAAGKSRVALYAAAKAAKVELDSRHSEERERTRRERIDGQAGDRGTRRTSPEEPADLGPEARTIIKALGGFGLTEDAFRAESAQRGGGRRGR